MKYALLSDIHSNLHALEACLAHAQTQGVERIAILGDLVSYGAFPSEVVARCQALQQEGAIVLRGNHEELIQTHHINSANPNPSLGSQTAEWTHHQLSPAQRFWLEILPLTAHVENIWLVHASADAPERWRYVDRPALAQTCLDAAAALQPPAAAPYSKALKVLGLKELSVLNGGVKAWNAAKLPMSKDENLVATSCKPIGVAGGCIGLSRTT